MARIIGLGLLKKSKILALRRVAVEYSVRARPTKTGGRLMMLFSLTYF
jgi:hypothetical protein